MGIGRDVPVRCGKLRLREAAFIADHCFADLRLIGEKELCGDVVSDLIFRKVGNGYLRAEHYVVMTVRRPRAERYSLGSYVTDRRCPVEIEAAEMSVFSSVRCTAATSIVR